MSPGAFLVVQWLRHSTSSAWGIGSTSGQRTKTLHVTQCSQKYIQTVKYHSVAQNNVLIHATTWMNLENIPSEPVTKDKILYDYYEMFKIGKFIVTGRLGVIWA